MARVTIEDCLENVSNMYELVHLATKRSRMLYRGADPLVKSKNRIIVTALREIAAKKVNSSLHTGSKVVEQDDAMSLISN